MVVSRSHAEIWVDENGQVLIREPTPSTGGTYVRGTRLSPDGSPMELSDQDHLQLGHNYRSNGESYHRCVKAIVEIDRVADELQYVPIVVMSADMYDLVTDLSAP